MLMQMASIIVHAKCALSKNYSIIIVTHFAIACRENRLLHKHPRLDEADIQLTDVNEYAVTVTNPQRVIVRGFIREKLPPALTIKSSHIRIGKSIGQGNIKTGYLRNNNSSILNLLIIYYL